MIWAGGGVRRRYGSGAAVVALAVGCWLLAAQRTSEDGGRLRRQADGGAGLVDCNLKHTCWQFKSWIAVRLRGFLKTAVPSHSCPENVTATTTEAPASQRPATPDRNNDVSLVATENRAKLLEAVRPTNETVLDYGQSSIFSRVERGLAPPSKVSSPAKAAAVPPRARALRALALALASLPPLAQADADGARGEMVSEGIPMV